MITSQILKALSISHCDFNNLQGLPVSGPRFLRD